MTGTQIGAQLSRNYITSDITEGRGHSLGETHIGEDGKEWMFVRASTAIAQYDAVWVKSTQEASPITVALAKTAGFFGIAQIAIALDTYGWVQQRGACTVSAKAAAAAANVLYVSATAGQIDDATLSVRIQGLAIMSAEAASVATAIMDRVVMFLQETAA